MRQAQRKGPRARTFPSKTYSFPLLSTMPSSYRHAHFQRLDQYARGLGARKSTHKVACGYEGLTTHGAETAAHPLYAQGWDCCDREAAVKTAPTESVSLPLT